MQVRPSAKGTCPDEEQGRIRWASCSLIQKRAGRRRPSFQRRLRLAAAGDKPDKGRGVHARMQDANKRRDLSVALLVVSASSDP